MVSSLTTIPAELKVSVFGSCDDLDDALHLSQVCRDLRSLFRTRRRIIEKYIITSSHVYDYDFCLSKLLTMREASAPHYRKLGIQLPDRHKPSIKAFEACFLTGDNKEGSTDEEIQKIIVRWKHFSFLRGLYVNDDVSKDFERFRIGFAGTPTPAANVTNAIIVPAGLDNASVQTSHVNRVQFMQNNRFAGDFKAHFHKILCLHSMAIPAAAEPKQEDIDVVETIEHLWTKEGVLAGGKTTEFDLDTQLDGLEVFDFLYMFLLKKIIPCHSLISWIRNEFGDEPLEWRVAGVPDEVELSEWYSCLQTCRALLQPDDLRDLIEERVWDGSHYGPSNKSMYMRVRGMFEGGNQNGHWNVDIGRSAMVRVLYADGLTGAEDSCWWDHARIRLGSPFLKDFVYKYVDEISKMHEERVRKR